MNLERKKEKKSALLHSLLWLWLLLCWNHATECLLGAAFAAVTSRALSLEIVLRNTGQVLQKVKLGVTDSTLFRLTRDSIDHEFSRATSSSSVSTK